MDTPILEIIGERTTMYQTKSRKCIGIDPGLANSGYAVISRNSTGKLNIIESGSIITDPKQTQAQRLLHLYQDISQIIHAHHPHLVAIEKVYFNKNVSSAITTGGVIGVCLLTAEIAGIESRLLTPQQEADATGTGQASKETMKRYLARILGTEIRNHHEADAAAIAIAGLLHPNIKDKKEVRP